MRALNQFLSIGALLGLTAIPAHAQIAINSTGAPPTSNNAMLEVSASNKGFLVPRVTSAQRLLITGVQGLLVYQDVDAGPTSPAGYWYFDGSWRYVSSSRAWTLGGNAGVDPAVDFVGTTGAQAWAIRTSSVERMRFGANGTWMIHSGTVPAESDKLHVQGGVRIGNTATNNPGTIRFNSSGAVSATNPGRFEGNVTNAAPVNTGWVQLDNVLGSRYNQGYPLVVGGCDPPTSTTAPGAAPRPWCIIGPQQVSLGNMTETPYTYLWEDSRHQYLYRSDSIQAEGICSDIKSVAFDVSFAGGARLHWFRVSMLNTTTGSLTGNFIPGATLVHTTGIPSPINDPGHASGFITVGGWNVHDFTVASGDGTPSVASFTWGGPGYNIVVETSMDNQTWAGGQSNVWGFNTTYNSMAGIFCDACGGTGSTTCGWTNGFTAANRHPVGSQTFQFPGPPFPAPNLAPIDGWGFRGGGYMTVGQNMITCDGTFAWDPGANFTISQRLPRIAFRANYVGGGVALGKVDYIAAQQGVMIGDATWAQSTDGAAPHHKFKGPGTISAQKSVWGGTVLLSDHVFDLYYDKTARPEDADRAAGYKPTPIKEMGYYVQQQRHLPTIQGRDEWERNGPFSVDHLTNQLWVTVEEQSLYIKELNERMEALQRYLVEKRLQELQVKPIQD
ncbi:MAG TPA: hypothetical protein VGE21_16560 [Flavobacteriales bacterium]